jgi:hypothetical protein
MTAYLTVSEFKVLTVMPSEFVDAIETVTPGWTAAQLALESARMDSRLSKRYAVPFVAPIPAAVQGWLSAIVTVRAYMKRGFDPTDQQALEYKAQADAAIADLKEAADSNDGLFDLPLRADTTATGIAKGGPRSYSETSPYVFADRQVAVGRNEDAAGGGTGG